MQMTTTSPMHSFHALYSKSKLTRGYKGKERERRGRKKGKIVKKRKEKGNKGKKKGGAPYIQLLKLCLN
jgi:hypothetical protein